MKENPAIYRTKFSVGLSDDELELLGQWAIEDECSIGAEIRLAVAHERERRAATPSQQLAEVVG